jgi:hypothetical protein
MNQIWKVLVRTVDAWSAEQLRTLLCMIRDKLYHLVLFIGDTGKNSHEKLPCEENSSM